MIRQTITSLGFYAEVENSKTKECFGISTCLAPYGSYETNVFRTSDLMSATSDVCAVKPILVLYSPSLKEAKQKHIEISGLFERLEPEEVTKKYAKEADKTKPYKEEREKAVTRLIDKKS